MYKFDLRVRRLARLEFFWQLLRVLVFRRRSRNLFTFRIIRDSRLLLTLLYRVLYRPVRCPLNRRMRLSLCPAWRTFWLARPRLGLTLTTMTRPRRLVTWRTTLLYLFRCFVRHATTALLHLWMYRSRTWSRVARLIWLIVVVRLWLRVSLLSLLSRTRNPNLYPSWTALDRLLYIRSNTLRSFLMEGS